MRSIILIFVACMMIAFTACSKIDSEQEVELVAIGTRPVLDQSPKANESAVVGQVVTVAGRRPAPLPETEVRLAVVHWNDDKSDGAFVVDGSSSPTSITDLKGGFTFTGIEPRDYVIVVGDLYSKHIILAHPDGEAIIYSTAGGEVLDVGVLEVDLEPIAKVTATPIEIYPAPLMTATRNPDKYP